MLILMGILSGLYSLPRELVVVEIGTGTWCQYCPGASMGAHDLLTNGYAVAVVKNHNGDSFTNAASNARNTYYGINSFPTALFDGLNRVAGGSNTQSMYSSYFPRVNARMAIPAHYSISATGASSGNNYLVVVNVAKPEADTNTNVVLHSALTQSNIAFNWQGQTQINNAMRLMMPNQNGTPVSLATGEQTSIPLSFTIQSTWPVQDLELVLWLQNTVTKEILQGKKYALNALPAGASVQTDYMMFPSISVNSTTNQQLILANYGSTTVTGTISIDNPVFSSSLSAFTIAPASAQTVTLSFTPLQPVPYEGILTVNGNFIDGQEFIIILNGSAFANTPPVANTVSQTGIPVLNETITGSYTYSDPENHPEGATQFKWYRVMNGTPSLITGATSQSYQITVADIGYQIAFEVTPADIHGLIGQPVMSALTPVVISLPAPQNFTAVVELPHVVCTWQKPLYYENRGLSGYQLFRNDLNIANFTDPNTLTFTDTYLDDGVYEYKICSVFNNPNSVSEPSPIVTVVIGDVANDDLVANPSPSISVFPNPFSATASFTISLKAKQPTTLAIYNIKGQLVRSFAINPDSKGKARVNWDGKNDKGLPATNGLYFYSIVNGSELLNGKLMLLK